MIAVRGATQRRDPRFEQALRRASDAPRRTGNDITLLKNGPATYDDWLEAIAEAERWVHLENYIFGDDGIGRRVAGALSAKAREGVPVRVLYDWFGCSNVPRSFWAKLRRAGVEVRAVNPPRLREGVRRFVRRDHRKLVGVDGLYASVGGICIADGWLERSSETGLPYRDTAVAFRGPAVADAERAFAGVWDLSGREPLPEEERPEADAIAPAGETEARVVIQEPGRARVLRALEILLASVQDRMWIADAYFLSAPTLTQAIMSAARDGVDVRILLPATNDLPWIGAVSRTGYRALLQSGVRIFEYGGPMMHAKTHVADGRYSRVGSTNLNFSGLLANWEADLMVEDPSFGAEMDEMFEEDLENAREVRLKTVPSPVRPDARRPKAIPERPINETERRDGRRTQRGSVHGGVRGSSGAATATASRLGGEALRGIADGGPSFDSYERKIGAALSAGALGLSLLAARRPRLVAWPLAAAGGIAGTLGLLQAVQSARYERRSGAKAPPTTLGTAQPRIGGRRERPAGAIVLAFVSRIEGGAGMVLEDGRASVERLGTAEDPGRMAEDARAGLLATPKDLSPWPKYFYDERGSELFEEITAQPEYYQTRAEAGILGEEARGIFSRIGCRELVELGSGAASPKTRALLDAMAAEASTEVRDDPDEAAVHYVPLDVSESALKGSAITLLEEYPGLRVSGFVGDFEGSLEALLARPSWPGGRLVAFLGGTLGNFTPQKRRDFLGRLAGGLRDGDHALIGVDLVKDARVIEAAYNDAAGVTAEFNKNMLLVLNRELEARFDPSLFEHRAFYDAGKERVEMWLDSTLDQEVPVEALDLAVRFGAGEGMRTEISAKFTRESAAGALKEAGLELLELYTDPDGLFGLALGRPESPGTV